MNAWAGGGSLSDAFYRVPGRVSFVRRSRVLGLLLGRGLWRWRRREKKEGECSSSLSLGNKQVRMKRMWYSAMNMSHRLPFPGGLSGLCSLRHFYPSAGFCHAGFPLSFLPFFAFSLSVSPSLPLSRAERVKRTLSIPISKSKKNPSAPFSSPNPLPRKVPSITNDSFSFTFFFFFCQLWSFQSGHKFKCVRYQ